MCSFEEKWIRPFRATVLNKVWLCYVVDMSTVFKSKESVLKFENNLNSCYGSIKFSHKIEKVGQYLFLTFWSREKDLNLELTEKVYLSSCKINLIRMY